MMLTVRVIEAQSLWAMDMNGLSDPYVKIKLGKKRGKTKVVKKTLNPQWDEAFNFRVGNLNGELVVSVLNEDKFFSDDFLGIVKVPLQRVLDAENQSLGTAWYPLQPKKKKSKNKPSGEILLSIYMSHKNALEDRCFLPEPHTIELSSSTDNSRELAPESQSLASNGDMESLYESGSSSDVKTESSYYDVEVEEDSSVEEKSNSSFFENLFQIFTRKPIDITSSDTGMLDSSKISLEKSPSREGKENQNVAVSESSYEELLKFMESKTVEAEMPKSLSGGILVDQYFAVTPGELNSFLFSPSSKFFQSIADLQGTTCLQAGAWRLDSETQSLKRTITFVKAASKLMKASKATDEQNYLRADGKSYALLATVSAPDVPFGNCFKIEVLYCITAGPESDPVGQPSCHLVISWRVNFLQSTMMKGMIEGGARQGLKDSYAQFSDLLSQNIKPLELKDIGSSKEFVLSLLQKAHESDFRLAIRFLGNFTIISTFFIGLYVLIHILLSSLNVTRVLEFAGLDLPDSFSELLVCGFLVLQGERALGMIGRFLHARKQEGSDHGVKAQGDGWLLTVALIEGNSLAAVDSTGFSDPYIIFTCNGKTKSSSIKFQTLNPLWNEIFEFDAMDEPPSVMKVDVLDFDGPFDEPKILGRAEINFVKSNISDLEDIWINLEGKLAQECQSRLHLKIFLHNSLGSKVVTDYLSKMEKEVGKKINQRSQQTNSAFQKLFGLPSVEFLVDDFSCCLKRKMPLQGRLFLSPRISGFYTNLFGHKTKFFFLWEDVEDIQVVPPTLSTMGSPSLMIMLRRGRGMDARHGAKMQDQDGRLKYHFHSFSSFNGANKTIMALWRARSLSPEQKMKIVKEGNEAKSPSSEDSGSFLVIEDTNMSEIFAASIPIPVSSLSEMFEGGSLEHRVMERIGCIDYSTTPWEPVKPDVHQRQVHHKLDRLLYHCTGEVMSTQQKSRLPDKNGWVVEEVIIFQSVLLADYFNLHLRYQVEEGVSSSSNVQFSLGIAWLKSTKHQKKITKNVMSNTQARVKEMFRQAEKEIVK